MTASLLTTKLHIPPRRPRLVERPRLLERLRDGLQAGHKLTVVSAPPGYGKTTLLTTWVAGADRPFAWLSLDTADNDPVRFLSYLVGALQTVRPALGSELLNAVQPLRPGPPELALTALLNELAATNAPLGLVLDDYHVIKEKLIHDALVLLLDHLPQQVHLVIATRADPPLGLSRLRGRGQLTELRQRDLRFTREEVATFLSETMGLEIAERHSQTLAARTEGWIAGLQMVAVTLDGQSDVDGLVEGFTGDQRYILDYLTEEVLSHQPENVQRFLLRTSILDRLCGSLCDALLDDATTVDAGDALPAGTLAGRLKATSSQTLLEQLERANLFVVPLDNGRQWYRYHQLFADLLRNQMARLHGDEIPALHRRASLWHERNGFPDEALRHALDAGDPLRAAELVEPYGVTLLNRGELTTIARWLDALPEELVRARPWLSVYHAWTLVMTGQLEMVEPHLQDAEKHPLHNAADQQWLCGHVAAIRSYGASYSGDATRSASYAREALRLLPANDLLLRSAVSLTLGMGCLLDGDYSEAFQALEEADRAGRASGNIHASVSAISALGGQLIAMGRLHQAAETYHEALRLATARDGSPLPLSAGAYSGLSELHCEWNDLDVAMQYAQQAIRLGTQWGHAEIMVRTPLALARVRQAQGDVEGANTALQEAERLAQERGVSPWASARIQTSRVRLWLAPVGGDLAEAARWCSARECVLRGGVELPPAQELEHLALARVLIALGRHGDALGLLARLRTTAHAQGRIGRELEISVLEAIAHRRNGDSNQAISVLEKALPLAEPEGYVRTFLDGGDPIAALLFELTGNRHSPHIHYVHRLLAAFEISVDGRSRTVSVSDPADRTAALTPFPVAEPLTDRETEVLHCIAAGLSNPEIAERFVVSTSTVKKHINHIFGKLGVTSRTQALVRAKEMGLL